VSLHCDALRAIGISCKSFEVLLTEAQRSMDGVRHERLGPTATWRLASAALLGPRKSQKCDERKLQARPPTQRQVATPESRSDESGALHALSSAQTTKNQLQSRQRVEALARHNATRRESGGGDSVTRESVQEPSLRGGPRSSSETCTSMPGRAGKFAETASTHVTLASAIKLAETSSNMRAHVSESACRRRIHAAIEAQRFERVVHTLRRCAAKSRRSWLPST
jgi:hypothetical protein